MAVPGQCRHQGLGLPTTGSVKRPQSIVALPLAFPTSLPVTNQNEPHTVMMPDPCERLGPNFDAVIMAMPAQVTAPLLKCLTRVHADVDRFDVPSGLDGRTRLGPSSAQSRRRPRP